MKKFNLLLVCFAAFSLLFTACDKKKNNGDDGDSGNTYTINVSVVDGNTYDLDEVVAISSYYDATDDIWKDLELGKAEYNNGNFKINMPKTIDSKYLMNVLEAFDEDDDTTPFIAMPTEDINFQISNKDAMVLAEPVSFEALKNGNYQADIIYGELLSIMGFNIPVPSFYYYADRPVKITGTLTETDGMPAMNFVFDVDLVAGWNVLRMKTSVVGMTEINVTMTANDVQGLQWYYYDANSMPGFMSIQSLTPEMEK